MQALAMQGDDLRPVAPAGHTAIQLQACPLARSRSKFNQNVLNIDLLAPGDELETLLGHFRMEINTVKPFRT